MKRLAFFPGTFDPFTVGHADIVSRSLGLFDEVVVAVGVNEEKKTLFTPQQRIEMIKEVYGDNPRVQVLSYSGITTELAIAMGACAIVRGVRSVKDYEYERDIAEVNRMINGMETVLLFSDARYAAVSSSVVRELLHFGKEVAPLLPPEIDLHKYIMIK